MLEKTIRGQAVHWMQGWGDVIKDVVLGLFLRVCNSATAKFTKACTCCIVRVNKSCGGNGKEGKGCRETHLLKCKFFVLDTCFFVFSFF